MLDVGQRPKAEGPGAEAQDRMTPGSVNVVLVHDWLTGMRGGEKVLESLCRLFPDAPILTLVHVRGAVSPLIERHPIRAVSPLFHVTAESPPMLVLHGRKDTSVPIAQAEAFAAAAKKSGARVELVVFDTMAHAFLLRQYGDPETMRTAMKRVAQFLGEP